MNGTTSQLLSLISYGNQFLKTGVVPEDYYPNNLSFKFCNQVNFLDLKAESEGHREEEVAKDPVAWFNYLKQQGCISLAAYYHPSKSNETDTPDYKLAGMIGGGGTWLLEAIYPAYSDFWASRWEANQPNDPDQNIWKVSYGRTVSETQTINFCPDLVETARAFQEILTDVSAFASAHELTNWADIFQKALGILNGGTDRDQWYGNQICETGYDQAALRLIYAAMAAHVFGGMGSWNDLGFETAEDNEEYNELSYYLYDWMNRSLLSGINSVR